MQFQVWIKWLGWMDSNHRMQGSKPCALPLGDTPTNSLYYLYYMVLYMVLFFSIRLSNALIAYALVTVFAVRQRIHARCHKAMPKSGL